MPRESPGDSGRIGPSRPAAPEAADRWRKRSGERPAFRSGLTESILSDLNDVWGPYGEVSFLRRSDFGFLLQPAIQVGGIQGGALFVPPLRCRPYPSDDRTSSLGGTPPQHPALGPSRREETPAGLQGEGRGRSKEEPPTPTPLRLVGRQVASPNISR